MKVQEDTKAASRKSRIDLIVLLLLGAITVSCAWIYRDFAQDDAFITYRYAANLSNGLGFVYNPGEYVLGTSTPFYAIILALLAKLSGLEVRILAYLVGVASLWFSAVLLYSLGKEYAVAEAAAVSIVFISNPLLLSTMGMETLFLLALLLLSLKSYLSQRFYLTGFLLGLLALTRYETLLLAALLGLLFFIQQRRVPLWLVFALPPLLLWAFYAWHSFGSVIPNSAAAKLVDRAAGHGYSFAIGAVLWWRVYGFQSSWYYALLPLILLGGYAALRNKRHHQPYMILLAWSVLYFSAAALAALSFSWYYGPLIPAFAILVTWGAESLAMFFGLLLQKLPVTKDLRYPIHLGPFILFLLAVLLLQISAWSSYWVSTGDRVVDARYDSYREIALWLNDHGNAQQTVASHEIGVLGYYTEMRIIDFHGLVTPGLLPWLSHEEIERLDKTIDIYSPDYILTSNPDYMEFIERLDKYERVQVVFERALVLYRRKPTSLSEQDVSKL